MCHFLSQKIIKHKTHNLVKMALCYLYLYFALYNFKIMQTIFNSQSIVVDASLKPNDKISLLLLESMHIYIIIYIYNVYIYIMYIYI